MADLEEIKKQFEALQKTVADQAARLGEQAQVLDQARQDQREALSMAKTVIDQQAETPASLYIPRERKCSDFTGYPAEGEPCGEEWIASIKSCFKIESQKRIELSCSDSTSRVKQS